MRLDQLPAFSEITPIDCVNGLAKLSIEFETELGLHTERLTQMPNTFESVIHPLEVKAMPLNYAWKTVKHLNYVKRSEKYPKAFRRVHPHVLAAKNEKWSNKILYKAVQDLRSANSIGGDSGGGGGGEAASAAVSVAVRLDEFQSRVLDVYELNGRLNGIKLSETEMGKLKYYLHELADEKQKFRDLVVEHEAKFSSTLTNQSDVADMPESLVKALLAPAEDDGGGGSPKGPWKVSLNPEIYHPFMEYCPNRLARWNAWCAFYDKGGPSHGVHKTNKKRIEDIRLWRLKQAEILGFKSFAEMSQETKMAGGVDVVLGFLENMRSFGRPVIDEQLKNLESFALESGGLGTGKKARLELHDVPFYRRLQRQSLFPDGEDDAKVADFFEFEHVFHQMTEICAQLFGLEFTRSSTEGLSPDVDLYHPDVRAYQIKDLTTGETSFLYVDPFSRADKVDGTWFETGRERCSLTSSSPIGYLNCNFTPSSKHAGSPVLLSFNQLNDLFFEMGMALRNLLTLTPYSEISGSKNVEWDAVDVVGFVMTHLLSDFSVLSRLSRHVITEERLPEALFDQIIGNHRHMSAYDLMWQCFLATFDIEVYASIKTVWMDLVRHIFQLYFGPFFPMDRDHFNLPCSFTQIFSEDYPAAYYSQKWGEMVAADAWSKFEETGFSLDNPDSIAVGHLFKSTFLALGGGIHSTEVFRRFKGSDPSTDAMLRKYRLM